MSPRSMRPFLVILKDSMRLRVLLYLENAPWQSLAGWVRVGCDSKARYRTLWVIFWVVVLSR